MNAVVLAAGRGTRLEEAGIGVPKPLVPVAGRTALDRVLDGLDAAGIDRTFVVTGHRAEEVEAHLLGRDGVVCVRQRDQLGTADAVLVVANLAPPEPFLVTWADVIVRPDQYGAIVSGAEGADGSLAVNTLEKVSAGAAVIIRDGLVREIIEKPARGSVTTSWNSSGLFVLGPAIWPHIATATLSRRGEIELPGAIQTWINAGASVRAVPITGYWFDVGTPETLAAASASLLDQSE